MSRISTPLSPSHERLQAALAEPLTSDLWSSCPRSRTCMTTPTFPQRGRPPCAQPALKIWQHCLSALAQSEARGPAWVCVSVHWKSFVREQRRKEMDPSTLVNHPVASQEEWTAARMRLLEQEKNLTRARDTLSEQRRALPWVRS